MQKYHFKISYIILINIVYCSSLFSQILVQNFNNDAYFGQSPQTAIRSSGIGNYGFDSDEMFFNPRSSDIKSDFILGISALFNVNSGLYRTNSSRVETRRYSTNIDDNAFDFFLKYKHKDYDFHLNYFTNLFFRQKGQNGLDVLFFFETYNGPQNLLGLNPEYYISNKTMQFAVSRKFDSFTLAAGFLTNRYIYKIVLDDPYSVELKSNFLENIQLLISLNYNYENLLRFYLLGRTENSEIELIPDIHSIETSLISRYKLLVSFPAMVVYGIQYNLIGELKLSVEMCHDFLTTNNDPDLFKRWGQKLSTSEMILGINYTLFGTWQIGALYSRFLEYKSGVRFESHVVYEGAVFFPIETLQMYKLATSYKYKDWALQANYQYGVSEYDLPDNVYMQEKSQLLRFSIITNF